jgi:pSer/pThr/pTyr-binding forkhead associated (FHA) protein
MRIVVKQKDGPAREFQFSKGPISIGRAVNNMILLPDRAVSKQHAIISVSNNGKWIIEDMDSANKTYLNNEAIHKAEIKHGDCLRITCFDIEIDLEEKPEIDEATQMEDTLNLEASLSIPVHETVVRKPDAGHAPAMRLPAKRLNDFLQATEAICDANNLEELLLTLLNITQKQFSAFHTWCALREQPSGPMTYHAGKRRDGQVVELSDIKLSEKINQAVERGQSLVMPRVAADVEERARIRSAIIATIRRTAGCYGVIYVDNAMVHEHYSLSDLDYLMMLAMHTAAVLKRFINS